MCLGFLCTKDQIILRIIYEARFSVYRCGASTLYRATHIHYDSPKNKDHIQIKLYTKRPTHTHTHCDRLRHKGPIQMTTQSDRNTHYDIKTHKNFIQITHYTKDPQTLYKPTHKTSCTGGC